MSTTYWNELSNHFILISALLAGFSIAFIANLIVSESNTRVSRYLLIVATVAASCFLVAVFSMTKILMMTTEGYPLKFNKNDFNLPRVLGGAAFLIGLFALSTLIALSGWTKSKAIGIVTTIIAVLTLVILLMVS